VKVTEIFIEIAHYYFVLCGLLFLYPLKLALASLTGGDRSIGIVRLRTKTTEWALVTLKGQEIVAALHLDFVAHVTWYNISSAKLFFPRHTATINLHLLVP
jgi:hypothetical protein